MKPRTKRILDHCLSILIVICMLYSLLPPPVYTAPQPPPPNYTEDLLAASSTLIQDDRGNLSFPHPKSSPGSARGVVLPYADVGVGESTLTPNPFTNLVNETIPVSGQGSRSSQMLVGPTSSFPAELQPLPPVYAPPLQLTISGYTNPVALQSQSVITQVFLPLIADNGQEPPATSVIGRKAIFDLLLPDAQVLAAELSFSAEQITQVQAVVEAERSAIAALISETQVILEDNHQTVAQKQAAIAAVNYNERLLAMLSDSQSQLRNQLGSAAYSQLVTWLDMQWQYLVAQRNAIRSNLNQSEVSVSATTDACPTFDVFTTRSKHTNISADLSDKYVKFANLGLEYAEGYTNTTVYSITVKYNAASVPDVIVTDTVWNHNDNYWNTVADTLHPRRLFTDLPQGMPEAEAAYFDDYNGGLNEFGQLVTNPAGLNISPQVASQLGVVGNAWVEVTFPWDCTISDDNDLPPSSRLERAWGTDNDWTRYTAHLVNPVTGNQLLWFRDLYIPAPGLPLDFVRYYNSQDGADSIFGRGWASQFDMRVYPEIGGSYKVRYDDGQRAIFRPDGSDGFVGEADVFDSFSLDGDGYMLTTTDRLIYHFNSAGRLQNIQDLIGTQITLNYTGDNPTQIIDSVGRVITLTFNGDGHVTNIEDPAGRVVTYTYGIPTLGPVVLGVETDGLDTISASAVSAPLMSVTDPNSGPTTYTYDPATQAVASATDPDGITFVENLYDAQGRVRRQFGVGGDSEFVYNLENLRATATDKLGNTTTYIFDKKYRVVEEIDALTNSIHYEYDDQDNMIVKTDRRGNTWHYAYDGRGNMTLREDPIDDWSAVYYSSDVTTWEYNERNQVMTMTNALDEVTEYRYDGQGNLTEVIEPNEASTTSVFNGQGQMTIMTDAEGRTTTFEYDPDGNRNKIIDPNQGVTLIEYDAVGRVLSRTDPEGYTTHYEYDGNGNVTKIVDPLGGVIRREYNGNNLLVRQIDRRGGVYEFTYDDDLNRITEKDPLGNVLEYEYDVMHNRTRMTAPNSNVTTYEYDDLYHITDVTDPAGYVSHYEYDENGNLTKAIDALGGETRFVYDALNRRKFVIDALEHQMEFCYDALDRAICTFDARRAQTRYEYDLVGNMTRIVDPLGTVTHMTYDGVHNRTSLTDPNGHTTHYSYDKLNRLEVETDPLGNAVRTTYDKVGNPTAITNANGNVTNFVYNGNTWLTRVIDAIEETTSFTYDPEGSLITTIDAKGRRSFSEYDLLGRVVAVTDELGHRTHFRYDANSNQIEVIDANGHSTRYEYDIRDLPVKEIDPLGHATIYEYDGLKRLVRAIDANNKATTYGYDAISRLTGVADARREVYRYAYDEVGNQTEIVDSRGVATKFEYNLRNELIEETNPLDRNWSYHYDPAGNMLMQIDGKLQAIRYEYDAANRLVGTAYPDGKRVVYEYDPNGNQIGMADWNGVLTETYDALNRRSSATDYAGRQLSYSYDQIGSLTGLTYPDGQIVTYEYTPRYELKTMTDPAGLVTGYSYDPVGLLTDLVRPNETRTELSYDAANRLTDLNNIGAGEAIVAGFEFTLDPVGNRTQMVETRIGAGTVTYQYDYDQIYQLVGVTSDQGQAIEYVYDAVGNRSEAKGVPKPAPDDPLIPIDVNYDYDDLNALLQADETTFDYDANGNRIQAVEPISESKYALSGLQGTLITNYIFDVENRLVTAREIINYETTINNAIGYAEVVVMEADYSYDGLGRRIAKLAQKYDLSGTVTEALLREYVYNGLDVVAEYEYVNGALSPDVNHYYYANGEKVTLERMPAGESAKKYWFVYDALGTAAALLNVDGLLVAEYHHDEFGRLIVGDSLLNRYLFTGQEYDPETDLIHFFARYYDSETGLWLTQDIERGQPSLPSTLHRYMYVANNPLNLTDALGYSFWDDAKDFGGDLWDAGTTYVQEKVVEPIKEYVVEPVVETVQNIKEAANKTFVQPAVNLYEQAKTWVNKEIVQPIEENVTEFVDHVNENYIRPAIDEAKEKLESTREALTKAADWIQENKMKVAATVGFVAGLAVGFVAAGAFCVATAGIGCAILVGAGAGLLAGGFAAGGTQMFANTFDSNSETGLFDNVLQAFGVGGVAGGIGGAIGGAAQFFLSGGSSLSNSSLDSLRRKAVSEAWKQEQALVKATGGGTRQWTPRQITQLLKTGKVKGFQGHHINSVSKFPQLAGNPNNIEFLTYTEHLAIHGNSWLNATSGQLVSRVIPSLIP